MSEKASERSLEIDFRMCGIEICQPYTGTNLSVAQREVEYEGKHLSNCVLLQYRISVAPDAALCGQEYVNRVLLEEGDLFLQALTLLLMRPSQLLVHQARLDGVKIKPELPPQDVPLGLYNLIAMWNRPLVTTRYSSVVQDNGWPLLETVVSEFRRRPLAVRNELAIALRWFAKGADEMTSLDRLVAFWISFNALYAETAKRELEAIKSYVLDNLDPVIAQRYVDGHEGLLLTLSSFPIELGRTRKRPIAQELAQALKASPRQHSAIVQTAALTVYGVRNNLFHGNYHPHLENNRKQIEVAENLLSRLVREFIAKRMLGYPLPQTRFVSQEKASF
jgi:hypothetical protein